MSLIIRSVNIRFLKTQETLIKNLTFEVKKGETITLMGASGCGKSTFLSYICGSLSANFQATGDFFGYSFFKRARKKNRKMGVDRKTNRMVNLRKIHLSQIVSL